MKKECLIIQYPYVIRAEARAKKVEELTKMREKGIIILDSTARVLSVPESVDILVEPVNPDPERRCEDDT